MRMPSAKRLMQTFQLDRTQANLIRSIGHAACQGGGLQKEIEKIPATVAYVRSLYSNPFCSHMWRRTIALHAIDQVMGTYGVESLGPGDPDNGYAPPYEYLNMGDTYATTLIFNRKTDTISIGNWGDIAERHPNWS